jgi:hypothetical protein
MIRELGQRRNALRFSILLLTRPGRETLAMISVVQRERAAKTRRSRLDEGQQLGVDPFLEGRTQPCGAPL